MRKISIRYGTFCVEYEGEEAFMRDELLSLVSQVVELAQGTPGVQTAIAAGEQAASTNIIPNISVKTISAKLGNAKGSDLARAAAAFLTLVQKNETFTQAELLNAMKSATGVYKQSTHGKNIGKVISSLMGSGFLIETAAGTYTVAQGQRDQLAIVLASSN
jgi:hypothetical protein